MRDDDPLRAEGVDPISTPGFDSDDLFDEDYLHFFRPILDDEQRLTTETELITRMLDLPGQAEILDLACGHGRLSNSLAEHGYRVTGLDAQPTFLERARENARAHQLTPTYHLGDMRALPWTHQFDGRELTMDSRRMRVLAHR